MSAKVCSSKSIRLMVWFLILAFFLPAPMAVNASPVSAYANDSPANAHVLRRLNSPERTAAIAEAARLDAIAHESLKQGEAAAAAAPVPREEKTGHSPAPASRETAAVTRPQSVTEVLFNHGASFLGVPGLTPQRGADGSLDEGLGFHQDGTARKAGGVASSSGPSVNGQRARSYMQTGLQNGYGMAGYAPGLYEELHYDLWGRNDSTRGGRVSSSSGYSRELGDFDPMSMAVDRGLNYGAGLLNSAGEAALSGLVDGGRARLNFRLDKDGYFNGEGDALLPFYDGTHTTIYTQLGARSMHDSDDTRWIGNFGLGQRWFPFAQGDDPKSGNYDAGILMLGYNAFFDYDLTRAHQRGGFGAELQYDWLRLSSNYYFPLSGWKGSEDFDSRFVNERPAEGWDARVKAYLPFYRNVAITGAYSQWYGDHVGMFGASKLEKDPKVWSYGLEYTPVPLVSGFITQKSTERGRTDTEFGLNFTYHFQMPWEQQISHSKVAELRTVSGSRHEFVDRENRIILEYKAKNAYHIEYLGPDGARGFLFRIRDGFGKYKAGQTVRVTASGNYLAEAPSIQPQGFFAQAAQFLDELLSVKAAYAADLSKSYTTDGQGRFWVQLESSAPLSTTVTIEAGTNSQTFTLAGGGGGSVSGLTLVVTYNRTSFVTSDYSATATITATATDAYGNSVTIGPTDVVWTVESSSITADWWNNRSSGAMNGLTWGATPVSLSGAETQRTDMTGNGGVAPTAATAQLTDIAGSRAVTVKAAMTINGTHYEETIPVSFGAGPLSVFKTAPTTSDRMNWTNAGNMCGTAGDINTSGYQTPTKLPRIEQLQAVAGSGNGGQYGAAHAAGWPNDSSFNFFVYWTGEAAGSANAATIVFLTTGDYNSTMNSINPDVVAVCLP